MLRYPKASLDYQVLKTKHQIEKRAAAEKQVAQCRDIIFGQRREIEHLKQQLEDQKMTTERMKECQERTKMHLGKALQELAEFYQKDGYDYKMSWFMTYTAAEQWKSLENFISENKGIAFHAYNTKGRKMPKLKRK